MTVSVDSQTAGFGALLLRLASGIAFLAHAYLKAFVFTMSGAMGFFESLGLPGFLAWVVLAGEVAGGVLLILGVHVRLASLWLIAILAGVVWAHSGNGWTFTNPNGGWEYPAFWLAAQVVILLQGPGALAVPFSIFGKRAAAA